MITYSFGYRDRPREGIDVHPIFKWEEDRKTCWLFCGTRLLLLLRKQTKKAIKDDPKKRKWIAVDWNGVLFNIYRQDELKEIEMQDSLEDSKKLAELLATDWFRTFAFTI